MSDRTLAAVTKELDQVAGEITSLEAQIQAKRDRLTTLVREQMEIQAETLSRFGLRLVLENSKDGLSVDTPKRSRAPRGSGTAQNPNKERNATIRAWAADNNISVPAKGKIPTDVVAKFDEANPS